MLVMSGMKSLVEKKSGKIYVINGRKFDCVLDAIEYRDYLDAHYIKVVWKQYERLQPSS
jgi:hypothetical protein